MTTVVTGLVLGAGLSGCAAATERDGRVAQDVTSALTRGAQTGEVVDLADAVGGDWDRLTFICPYEREDVVTERLGFRWGEHEGSDHTEGMSTFVFSRNDDVVDSARLPRSLGDPCGVDSSTSLSMSRADAAFEVERTSDATGGGPFHSLRQVRR